MCHVHHHQSAGGHQPQCITNSPSGWLRLSVPPETPCRLYHHRMIALDVVVKLHTVPSIHTHTHTQTPQWDISVSRLTITASCPMDLQYFPMDSQLCYIEIESCKFTLNACPPQPDSVCFQLVIRWVISVTSGTTGSTPYRCLGMCRCHSLRWFTAHDTACLKFLKTRTFINLPVQNFGTNAKFDNLTTKHCLHFLCGNTWCINLVFKRKQKSQKRLRDDSWVYTE